MATGHHSIFEEQARELYLRCDEEKKGFITREDMYRLISHLPLTAEQLESVFDSLDDDNNGQLTLEEFIVGFGRFLGAPIDLPHEEEADSDNEAESMMQHVSQEHLQHLVDRLHHVGLHEDVEAIKESWVQLQDQNPELLGQFEVIIENIISDMLKSKEEFQKLEGVLKTKTNTYEDEVKKLYDEMDVQLKTEKERLVKEEKQREKQLKIKLQEEINEKDALFQKIQKTHEESLKKLESLNGMHSESSQEKDKLERERNDLEAKLRLSDKALRDCQEYIEELNRKAKQERRNRAKAAIEMTEGIALERESLVRQLDELREINRYLQEEKSQKLLSRSLSSRDGSVMDLSKELQMATEEENQTRVFNVMEPALKKKRGSILSSYFTPMISVEKASEEMCKGFIYDDCEEDIIDEVQTPTRDYLHQSILSQQKVQSHVIANHTMVGSCDVPLCQEMEIQTEHEDLGERSAPDGAVELDQDIPNGLEKPERIFKVVFIGDSSVGKTSIIQRFSNNEFKSDGLPSTVGVDFCIKSIRVGHYFVAMQLWDTAGQERFRSITSQYYRKADAVVLVYDILSESSLLNLRRWMENVKEGVEVGTVIMVLANKSDTVGDGETQKREARDLKQLIDEPDLLYYECSAKTGHNIKEAFVDMATQLTSKEDYDLKTSIKLEETPKKGCCGR